MVVAAGDLEDATFSESFEADLEAPLFPCLLPKLSSKAGELSCDTIHSSIINQFLVIHQVHFAKLSTMSASNNDHLVQSEDPEHPANLIPRLCKQFYTLGRSSRWVVNRFSSTLMLSSRMGDWYWGRDQYSKG
jgi:hypothetical protein